LRINSLLIVDGIRTYQKIGESPYPARIQFTLILMEFTQPNVKSIRDQLIKGTASSFIIQIGFAGLSFITAVVLARLLGTESYGAYANAMAWVGIFGVFASFGFGSLLVRDVAILRSQGDYAELKGFLRYSNSFVFGFSIFLGLVVLVIARITYYSPDKEIMRQSLWIASLLIPLTALTSLKQSATRGLEHIAHSMLPDLIIRPMLILACVIAIYYFWPGGLNALTAMAISVLAAFITFSLSSFWLQGFLPVEVSQVQPKYKVRVWLTAAFPMLVYVGLQILIAQTSTVMLGLERSAEDVGLFAVAFRVSTLLTFFMGAVQSVLGPMMARLHANGEKKRLQEILTLTVRVSFLLTLLLSLVILFGSDYILSVFGSKFIIAKVALGILILGNLIDIASGSPALLLVMTGHERSVAIVFTIIAFVNVLLNALLISPYGFEGAAVASIISLILSRLILSIYALNNLHLNTTIFSFLSFRSL
jgi:O-antigen/teichoic acid export membrane protein